MSVNIENFYNDFITQMYSANTKVVVPTDFHAQVNAIDNILHNDVTGMISTINDFMVQSAVVPLHFESKNASLNKTFNEWKETINGDVNIDIPMGFRSLSEQYYRERWRSSFIVLNINWGKIGDYIMPVNMWFSDGGSIYVDKNGTDLKATKYYKSSKKIASNELKNGPRKSSIIRKPYNMWYEKYPTPYLVKKGALYHALVKQIILSKQTQAVQQAFPNMLAIKMGNDMAMKRNEMPKNQDFIDMKKKFIDLRNDGMDRTANDGLVGAFPYDVNFENLLPDFKKVLDADIMSGTDRNLLMALGLIEFKGFSTNREESVLNPKPLVSEIEDGVEDFMQLMGDVIYEIQRRNKATKRNFSAKEVIIGHDPIKSLLTDNMKLLIRSLYDRGLLSKEDTVEGTTAYKFVQQVEKRKQEIKDNLDETMKAPVIMNQDNKTTPDNRENSDPNMEKTPAKKKSETDVQARIESLTITQKDVFMKAFNRCIVRCEELDVDEDFKYATANEFANNALESYLNDSIRKNADLPEEILAMDSKKQMSFRKEFNSSLKDGYTLSEAIHKANKVIK